MSIKGQMTDPIPRCMPCPGYQTYNNHRRLATWRGIETQSRKGERHSREKERDTFGRMRGMHSGGGEGHSKEKGRETPLGEGERHSEEKERDRFRRRRGT